MKIALNDTRSLGIVVSRPAADTFFNWSSGAFESPFDHAKHVKPLSPMEKAPSPFATVQIADISDPLLNYNDAAALVVNLDATGNVIAVVDVWTLPFPVVNPPTGGGFTR